MTAIDTRLEQLTDWLRLTLGHTVARIEVASADASFRRYFRVFAADGGSTIAMDAPPAHEDVGPYLRITNLLRSTAVHVPHVHAADLVQGFVLLEDLGRTSYLEGLQDPDAVERLYGDALAALLRLQLHGADAAMALLPYDAAVLQREMQLMPEWFCDRHLQLSLGSAERELLEETFSLLTEAALQQPVVFVHRDYHSRNLMVLEQNNPGVIDFQDALRGPLTYDLASLLKDCYISWPRERVEAWVEQFRAEHARAGQFVVGSSRDFLRAFDWISAQRHIKVLGIFARLCHRDGKHGYLHDLPLTLAYLRDTARRYPELHTFGEWLESRVVPRLPAANAAALAAALAADQTTGDS